MGVMKMVTCFQTTARSDRNLKSTSPVSPQSDVNEYYRTLLQQFATHCQTPNRDVTDPEWLVYQRNEQNTELSPKKSKQEKPRSLQVIPGVPHVQHSEILEIGSVAGTENRYLEMISAEWRNTKVSLKRHTFKACKDAIRADMEILSEIRHPNIMLLMATTHTVEHGLVSIFEPVDCTLYNYIHVQGERMNIQGTIQIGIKLADALKYCHMRGYVHGALSSHCVYFTSDATVKLGGWELAREAQNVYVDRDYEKYLRIEIAKWQAPEMPYGLYSTNEKTDVYCLMLLLWEMSTGCVPCDGSDRSEVEIEYVTRDHGVSLRNVPSLLRNLLETGLQLDDAKRTLDMDKIGRELHRLLVIHEYKKSSANDYETNNNNNNDSSYDISNIKTSSPVSPVPSRVNYSQSLAKQESHSPAKKSEESIHQLVTPVKKQRHENAVSKNQLEKINASAMNNAATSGKGKASCSNCTEILNMVQDIDEKSNARADIKRLKQLIASQRERFFLGTDSSSCQEKNSKLKSAPSLKKSTSADYITCKPASHATAIEPRFNKSLNEYDGSRASCTLRRKTPYTCMPASIKDAIMQRQVLHADAKSFYESTLWRKEKEICLSRMGRNNKERGKIPSTLQRPINNNLSTIGEDKAAPFSVRLNETHINNDTYTIEAVAKDDNIANSEHSVSRNVEDTSARLPIANKSIQELKNALERASDIIRSITPTEAKNYHFNEKQARESAFENLDDGQKIPVMIESSTSRKKISHMNEHASAEGIVTAERGRSFNQTPVSENRLNSLMISFTRTSKGSRTRTRTNAADEQSSSSQKVDRNETVITNGTVIGTDVEPNEGRYVNVPFALNNMPTIDSQRHVSLPSGLDPTKMDCLINVPRRSDCQSTRCTTEDLYIDDELEGPNLNYNLVLLGDDYEYLLDDAAPCDDQRLPPTTEL